MNNKADISLIRDYLNGKLDAAAMYELERRAQDDPQLMDLMLGMEIGNAEEDQHHLMVIDELIKQRVRPAKTSKMVPWGKWVAAASLFLCASIAAFLMLRPPEQQVLQTANKQTANKQTANKKTVGKQNATIDKQTANKQVQESKTGLPEVARVKNAIVSNQGGSALNKAAMDALVKTSAKDRIALLKPGLSAGKATARLSEPALNRSAVTGEQAELSVMDARKDTVSMPNSSAIRIRGISSVPVNQALAGRVAGMVAAKEQPGVKKPYLLKGKVTEADGKTPLPGVAIRLIKQKKGTSTDINGNFSIEVPKNEETLLASMIGFDQKIVNINQDSLNIILKPNTAALNEVIVIGYGTQKVKAEKARPLAGWDAFNTYLKTYAKVGTGAGGKVTVAFTVNQDGSITGIRVVKSSGIAAIDAKAGALILTGPKWIGNSDGTAKEITLRIRFQK